MRDTVNIEHPVASVKISDESGKTVLRTLTPGSPITDRIMIYLDLNPSYDVSAITSRQVQKASWGSLNIVQQILLFLISIALFFFPVIVPLGFIIMIFSRIMELSRGVYRPFTVSWIKFLTGLGWFFLGYHFGVVGKMVHYPSPYARIFFIFICAGYLLYFFANRGYRRDDRIFSRNMMRNGPGKMTEQSSYGESPQRENVGTKRKGFMIFISVSGFIITPLFLPFAPFWCMYRYWLLPVRKKDHFRENGTFAT